MPRKPRVISDSGMYHILLRCVKNDSFFCDDYDYTKFLDFLKENRAECGYKLYAYMLSEKEIRLLIKVDEVGIENIFKRLCVKYTYWYNCKYSRSGSLFFDRFKSEPVENDEKFDEIYRYIIRYPETEGICKDYKKYKYNSFESDFGVDFYHEIDEVFLNMDINESYLKTSSQAIRITDEMALEIILGTMKKKSADELDEMSMEEKYSYAGELIDAGVGYRQLSRLTGMNYLTIKKYAGEDKAEKKPVKKKAPVKVVKKETKKIDKKPVEKVEEKKDTEVIDFFSL